ncbi:hypothetical protein JCM10450v2_006786 [Rhodotorula kratochvilovae]
MLRTTLARTTATATARIASRAPPQPHFVRAFTVSALCRKDPGEGIGKKQPVGGDNPVSARVKGVASGLKSAVDGAIGIGQAATGVRSPSRSPTGEKQADKREQEQSNLGAEKKHAGPDTRDALHAEQDKGKKEGLAHKGKQQANI